MDRPFKLRYPNRQQGATRYHSQRLTMCDRYNNKDHSSSNASTDVALIIRQGDEDIEAGNFQTLDEFMADFRAKNNILDDA